MNQVIAPPSLSSLVEAIRIAIFDQENMILTALDHASKDSERTESILKAANHINSDLFSAYEQLESFVNTNGGGQ